MQYYIVVTYNTIYLTQYERKKVKYLIRQWTQKRYPIPCAYGQSMGCLSDLFREKVPWVIENALYCVLWGHVFKSSGTHFMEDFSIHNWISMEIPFCCHPSCCKVIISKFCTWYDSCAVVTCTKFCSNIVTHSGVTQKQKQISIKFELRWKNN